MSNLRSSRVGEMISDTDDGGAAQIGNGLMALDDDQRCELFAESHTPVWMVCSAARWLWPPPPCRHTAHEHSQYPVVPANYMQISVPQWNWMRFWATSRVRLVSISPGFLRSRLRSRGNFFAKSHSGLVWSSAPGIEIKKTTSLNILPAGGEHSFFIFANVLQCDMNI